MAITDYKKVFSEYHRGPKPFIHLSSKPTSASRDAAIQQDDPEKLKAAIDKSAKNISTKIVFYGSHITDKAMQLNQLAKQTKRSICFIDCQQLVDNYIGETEKHLSRLIAQAESENWILFFDEADALFGKRSNVKDAHDRYANLETNDVFHRLSHTSSLAILSIAEKPKLGIIQYAVDSVISFR